ncbi:MAG: hypothetical protein FJ118_08030 [Deltaproteobacteria bacterium]|nr:hypothetical protein [Deltaproteobacteria bacterium]
MISKVTITITILAIAAGACQLAHAYTMYKGEIKTYELRGTAATHAPYSYSAVQAPATCPPPACPPPVAQSMPPAAQHAAPMYNAMPMQYYQPPQNAGRPMWR